MASPVFYEIGPYFCWCFAHPISGGGYTATVTFERKSDFIEAKTHVPGMRHQLEGHFETDKAALAAAATYAHATAESGEVGL